MSYVDTPDVVDSMLDAGSTKTTLSAGQLVLRSAFSVFLLAGATTLAIYASEETGLGIVGALLFPLGLVIVVLLNVELLTGNFALVPLSVIHRQSSMRGLFRNFSWVLLGHVLGGLLAAFLFAALLSQWWTTSSDITAQGLFDLAVTKTLDYQEFGYVGGAGLAFLSGILCNWLVVLGVVMGMTSTSTSGKILAIWPPIAAFFALDLEHSVVNLFAVPVGMMLGAPISIGDWWLWNQIPVLLGNLVGGLALVGLPLYYAHRSKKPES